MNDGVLSSIVLWSRFNLCNVNVKIKQKYTSIDLFENRNILPPS